MFEKLKRTVLQIMGRVVPEVNLQYVKLPELNLIESDTLVAKRKAAIEKLGDKHVLHRESSFKFEPGITVLKRQQGSASVTVLLAVLFAIALLGVISVAFCGG